VRVKKPPPAATQFRKPSAFAPTVPIISSGLRRYLYFTAAVTGAAVLVVEILGAKMLSPYVGTSHFVWTAQIAVTLVALAAGYYLGGWLVDRTARLGWMYGCILSAAIYLCFAVLICEPMAYWCLQFRLATGSLLASLILFFVPLTLLAVVCPFLVRILTQSVNAVGGQVGRLSAISTLGSVFGTVLIGYVLIPYLPNSTTMLITAALLLAVVLGYTLAWGRKTARVLETSIAVIFGLALGLGGLRQEQLKHFSEVDELFRRNSNFGLMQVLQFKQGNRRLYLNDYLVQNTYDPSEKKSLAMFTYLLHDLARAYTPQVNRVLCIGLGIGIVPMRFARENVTVDVVDINPAVVPMAARYFDFQPDRVNVVIGDGRYFLNRTTNHYDAIILDAFLGDSSPSHLFSKEAFAAMSRLLQATGTLVINCFGNLEPGRDFFTASLDKSLKSAFRSVRIHYGGSGNLFFVASNQSELRVFHAPDFEQVHRVARADVEAAFQGTAQANPAHGIVLTDDYNPVEFYDARNRELMRRQLAMMIRSL
jgi:spermidine synthase